MHLEETIFYTEISKIYKSNLPFVIFRKPKSNNLTAIAQKTAALYELTSFEQTGFIFAPFQNKEKTVLFPIDICNTITSKVKDKSFETVVNMDRKKENFSAKENHIKLVDKAIDYIKNDKAKKIVLSRKENFKQPNFNALNTFKKIVAAYQNAYVYLWFHPMVGLWMGASPEQLIHIQKNVFKTMALAGTRRYFDTEDVVWDDKEKIEQQIVTDYILKNIEGSIVNTKLSEPYAVKAGSLMHIRTDISGDLKSVDELPKLVDSLHPTPAVCGLPKNTATDFILNYEGYNRQYYTGFLGELNSNNIINLVVNLRCMSYKNKTVSIYVGGGITKESNAEKEWVETVSKAEIIKNVIQ